MNYEKNGDCFVLRHSLIDFSRSLPCMYIYIIINIVLITERRSMCTWKFSLKDKCVTDSKKIQLLYFLC